MLAALAAATSRIELGPLVASTSFHNPAMLAKKAATVDEISGGRLILGLGAGWNETEYRAFGFPFDHRISRFEEAFTIIRTLLSDGAIDFEGTYYTARDCEIRPRGPRPGGPPILLGSTGERMLAIGAPHIAAWNAWFVDFDNRPEGIAPLRERVDAAAAAAGRDPADDRADRRRPGPAERRRRPACRATSRSTSRSPLEGPPDVLAEGLRAFAREGISPRPGRARPDHDRLDRGVRGRPRRARPWLTHGSAAGKPAGPAMPAFTKSPPELVERFGATLAGYPQATLRKMFGYPAAFVNGNLATSLFAASWMVRLPDPAAAELLRLKGARPFEPMAGRAMRGYYVLPPAIVDDETELAAWLDRALTWTAGLPPKAAKG